MTRFQLQAKAEWERRLRRINALSQIVSEADINVARYDRWILARYPTLAHAQGLEISPEPDFLRSEVERFEAWTLRQGRMLGLDQLSDADLLKRYEDLWQKLTEEEDTDGLDR